MKDRLQSSTSFEFIKFGLEEPPDQPDQSLSVQRDAFWSYCGPLLSTLDDLPSSFHDWAHAALSGSLLPLLLPFLTFVNEFIRTNGLDHYWLTIRATKATTEYNKPRWHTDDMFFNRSSGDGGGIWARRRSLVVGGREKTELDLQTDWKLCATLLGPATMFIPAEHQAAARATCRSTKRDLATDHMCTSVRCVGCGATAEAVRDKLTTEFAPLGLVQAEPGECSIFRIGQERGAVHSEPCMSRGDRIFINVVPGKRDELSSLLAKWGMPFPRSWFIAPGVLRGHGLT
ncbi:hypothetical protein F4815DRAFT_418899 [Daldinia loculata]|uniref:uncharacterized protein n=1 Tax=Daldinia loculata TaxID=103429 RepID=UPI0020C44C29|nr:uncharacterized protein F4817DRAFT_10360 [Daldinia loculata]KAI1652305.1 hypothetical protein F4817DRAFT_10360 [Daldinia loculata]KAI2772098.1 hypothetical protein F4815DRAFT_418899 [Daldinia loculata]